MGTDYLVLRQGDFSTGCDLHALKFIEFHDDPRRDRCARRRIVVCWGQ
ncbi:MAG: hypothetical protein ACLR5H_07310 [Oscillospiraceae bacterium]